MVYFYVFYVMQTDDEISLYSYFVPLSCRKTKSLIVLSASVALFGVTTFPLTENTLSDGTELARHPSHFLATMDSFGKNCKLLFHQAKGQGNRFEILALANSCDVCK